MLRLINRLLCLFVFIVLHQGTLQAQIEDIESDEWYKIYDGSGLKAYVRFDVPPANVICGSNSKVKFEYKYLGTLRPSKSFAMWELDYLDCSGIAYKLTGYAPISSACANMNNVDKNEEFHFRETDEVITAKQLVELRANKGIVVEYESPLIQETTLKKSIQPEGAYASRNKVDYKEQVTLYVKGGKLGEGAKWFWYSGSCGGKKLIQEGREITINPEETATYFVRAEGVNTTSCASVGIEVDRSSKIPSSINGPSDVCEGNSIELEQFGGVLGPDTDWYWYEGGCGNGSVLKTGYRVEFQPKKTTTYFVRAQSKSGDYKSQCIQKNIQVRGMPTDPIRINNRSEDEICQGEKAILEVKGELTEGAKWIWKDVGTNRTVSTGNAELVISPEETTVYSVEAFNDACGSSKAVTEQVKVYRKSVTPRIEQQFDTKGRKSDLIVVGGYKADKSNWVWTNWEGKLGQGDKIQVTNKMKKKTVYVRAEGGKCRDTSGRAELFVKVGRERKPANVKYCKTNKKFHFGVQFGADLMGLQDTLYEQNNQQLKSSEIVAATGYWGGIELHPIFMEEFAFGFNGTYGKSEPYEYSYESNDTTRSNVSSFSKYSGGLDMAFTISKSNAAKMLLMGNRTIMDYDASSSHSAFDSISLQDTIVGSFANNGSLALDRLSFGFRFGTYGRDKKKDKLGVIFDLLFNLNNTTRTDDMADFSSYANVLDWNFGFESRLWVHSVLRMGAKFGFDSSLGDVFKGGKASLSFCQLSIAYNFDLFK